MMTELERAAKIAEIAYARRVDKAGYTLYAHALRVASDPLLTTDVERTVGILHDILEDTVVTAGQLRAWGFAEDVVAAVVALTRPTGIAYNDYVRALAGNPLARLVKIADLRDHLARKHLLPLTHRGLAKRYENALAILGVTP